MRKKSEKILIILFMAASVSAVHLYTSLYAPAAKGGAVKTFVVPQGASFRVIANNLVTEELLKDTGGFLFAARIKGAHKKIKAGEYELSSAMAPVEILTILIEGRIKQYIVMIPEGYNIWDIASLLEDANLADREAFIERATDKDFINSLGLPAAMKSPTLEGYLFPDTYNFTKSANVDDIIRKMVERFKDVYDMEFKDMAEAQGLNARLVITLASIIEKEAGGTEEMPLVSAVFHNRLRKKIPLQSDPTAVYGIENFNGNITRAHLRRKTPHNTYLKYGLPLTPIANPGRAAINAALNPAQADYLYFVSRNDGTHHFSETLGEHNQAVGVYQRSKSSNKPTS